MKRALLPFGVATAVVVGVLVALSGSGGHEFAPPELFPTLDSVEAGPPADWPETATFGSGCFWCTEAVFQRVKGVKSVKSGYSGGSVANPTYDEVCTGTTGHAEVVQLTFDPTTVSYPELLEVFWRSHDPTQRDRQGNDHGPQYRSVIFCHSERQKELADRYRRKIDEAGVYADPVATQIEPFTAFYPAGADHEDYYNRHSRTPYCRSTIGRKLDKLRAVFGDRLTD